MKQRIRRFLSASLRRLSGRRHPPLEVIAQLRTLGEWNALQATIPNSAASAIVRDVLRRGLTSRFLGHCPPNRVSMQGTDPREGLVAAGLNARQRAVLKILTHCEMAGDIHKCKTYMHEAVTTFALVMRGRYPKCIGSEYTPDLAAVDDLWPIPIIDITHANLPDSRFDFVLSNEVLEHVPDLDAALEDTARILKVGGQLIATHPFLYNCQETLICAQQINGEIKHLREPEYHGNPTDPEGGSLVFQLPGWDILQRCRQAGFRDAWMTFIASTRAGITADCGGIFVLQAIR